MPNSVETETNRAGKKTMMIVIVLLSIYYLISHSVQLYSYPDHVRFFGFNLSSLFFLIHLFYLPLAIAYIFLKQSKGWVLISIWLVFSCSNDLFNLLAELINPRELYHHPDAMTNVSRAEIYLMLLLPFIGFSTLLWLTQKPQVLTLYGIDPARRKHIFIYTIAVSLLLSSYIYFVYKPY